MSSVPESLTRVRRLGWLSMLESLLARFSPAERLLLYVFIIIMTASTFVMLGSINQSVSVSLPARGGSLTEGAVGPARFINPLLTLSQPDEDLSALVYSGLMRTLPDGTMIPDLAQNYNVSSDGTTYTFTIRPTATFHDGTPVTAEDVIFTVKQAQNSAIKSPRKADWAGVAVSSPDTHTVVFTLSHTYAPFIGNTTLGILPKHLWQNVSEEEFPFSPLNTHPIGSGPYKVGRLVTDSTGGATRYELTSFDAFALGAPYITTITFLFYPDTTTMRKAFEAHTLDTIAGVSPGDLSLITRTDSHVVSSVLPRVFGVFFNQGHNSALTDPSVRKALNDAVDKTAIVNSVLGGHGVVLDGPIPTRLLDESVPSDVKSLESTGDAAPHATTTTILEKAIASYAQNARTTLENGGWVFNTGSGLWEKNRRQLSITLATADEPELVKTANLVADSWKAAGIKSIVRIYPISELNTNVIRPRDYDAILFGEVVGPALDLYAFWHSSQRNNPGLNLAMYANETTDTLLSTARATTDKNLRNQLYKQFATDIRNDQPAIFLYSPDFLYIVPESIKGVTLGALTSPADRYSTVYEWYTQTQRVWSIFADSAR